MDLGCGTGVFLDQARRAGWHAAGVEVSAYAAEQARRRGLDVATAALERWSAPPASRDCITMWDVLEHLRDPAAVLRNAARALRPGGVLALSTGDLSSLCARLSGTRWHLFSLPEHLYFFTPRSLERLLGQVGMQVRRIVREVYWTPLTYIVERLRKIRGRVGRAPGWLPRRLVVPATLFDVVGVYAVKRG